MIERNKSRPERGCRRRDRARLSAAILLALLTTCAGAGTPNAMAATGGLAPCDIYALGGTPCIAAHSTTRALYASYRGALYEVKRIGDGRTLKIRTSRDGYADAAAQDAFCAGARCTVVKVFDQSPNHNDLTVAGPGGNGGPDVGVVAGELPITLDGHKAYGMSFDGDMGYRDNHAKGVATGAAPESMYMVTSGTHTNHDCCFDYGNAETNSLDTGNGHMDAISFTSECFFEWPTCYGRGPWVQADLENGLFMSDKGHSVEPGYTGSTTPFVTAMLKNNGVDSFAIKHANARQGGLATIWNGGLPDSHVPDHEITLPGSPNGPGPITSGPPLAGYRPMKKEGAIILGTGGDNSNTGVGDFFEGVMTRGYATDATENAVQANIVAAGYAPAAPGIRFAATGIADQINPTVSCPQRCTVQARVSAPAATTRRLHLRRSLLAGVTVSVTGTHRLSLRLPLVAIRPAQAAHLTRIGVLVTITATYHKGPSTTRSRLVEVRL